MRQPINFQQVRDFGGIFNATFEFIRQEYKLLGKTLLYYALPITLIATIVITYTTYIQMDTFTGGNIMYPNKAYYLSVAFSSLSSLIIVYIFTLLTYAYVAAYIKYGSNNFGLKEVLDFAKRKWLMLLIINILFSIMSFIGFIFCIIPGIYLFITFYFASYSYFNEDTELIESFSRSYNVISDNWWLTFGLFLVISMLIGTASMVFYIPAILISVITAATSAHGSPDLSIFKIVMVTATSLLTVLKGATTVVMVIAMEFQYFSLLKKKYDPELEQLINKVTKSENDSL